jgi:hypothetical protein
MLERYVRNWHVLFELYWFEPLQYPVQQSPSVPHEFPLPRHGMHKAPEPQTGPEQQSSSPLQPTPPRSVICGYPYY